MVVTQRPARVCGRYFLELKRRMRRGKKVFSLSPDLFLFFFFFFPLLFFSGTSFSCLSYIRRCLCHYSAHAYSSLPLTLLTLCLSSLSLLVGFVCLLPNWLREKKEKKKRRKEEKKKRRKEEKKKNYFFFSPPPQFLKKKLSSSFFLLLPLSPPFLFTTSLPRKWRSSFWQTSIR